MAPGKQVGSAGEDPFRPELGTYFVWLVEWAHEFDLGDAYEPPMKGRAVLWGVDPETGPGHEGSYWNPAEQGAG
ncbi:MULTISPECIES: hypothetical protein [Burkholderia]|uniref:hypothetical protein n=1 Tax=Burkholderia TaxID=32008 RepID=UPI001FC8A895|nr:MULTISPECIES: hypothetical protein [Burkholderia]